MAIKKVIVTGSSGTIGTRLCEKLAEKGYDIVGIDIRHNKWNSEVEKKTIIADMRNDHFFSRLPKDADIVVHLAANARVYDVVVEPGMARDNFNMLFNALEFSRLNGIKRFIFASSREVYGNSGKVTHSEDDICVKNCESPYTASKVAGEAMVHAYQKCYGINFVLFRFSNVYGMYDDSNRVVPLFVRLCRQGKPLTVFGKEKMLDFTYIDDAVAGIILSIEKFDKVKNDTFNLAFGEGVHITDVAKMIMGSLGNHKKITVKGVRTGEVVQYIADISNAKLKLGYSPKVGISEGIKKSVDWYTNNSKE